ncbi:MAG TPA: hypothetical protein VNX21_05895 [Candidatus Thermoplasmatota archaeon]|nr:hypothetical protein [Candidatus Thermoplasmatota archaeon]
MIRRLLLVVLVAAVALTPLALADHAYSHRYVVYGRVVDADGNPVQGVLVNLGYRQFQAEGPCAQQPGTGTDAWERTETRPQTNQLGEFLFCFHAHDINRVEPPFGVLTIEEHNYTTEFRFDPYTRTSFVPIKLDTVVEGANAEALETTYTVQGRLWEPAGERVSVERVGVFGHTVDRAPVNITIRFADGQEITTNTTTNNYGDFALRVPIQSRPTGGEVTIEANGQTFRGDVDPTFGITFIRGEFAEPKSDLAKNALIAAGVLLGLAVVGGGGWYAWRRTAERRELQEARLTSTRKRARR